MIKFELDRTDLRILRELQNNARLSNVELAERVGLSPSPCTRRVKLLEQNGVIRRYATFKFLTAKPAVRLTKKTALDHYTAF